MKWRSLSRVRLSVTPWAVHSTGFSRPEHCNGQPFPPPGNLPNPGIEPSSLALQADSLPAEPPGKLLSGPHFETLGGSVTCDGDSSPTCSSVLTELVLGGTQAFFVKFQKQVKLVFKALGSPYPHSLFVHWMCVRSVAVVSDSLWPHGLQPPGSSDHGILWDLPHPGVEPTSLAPPALAGRLFTTSPPGKPVCWVSWLNLRKGQRD